MTREKSQTDFGAVQFDAPLPPGLTYMHCRHGKDRTGLIAAIYRVAAHNYSPDQAYQEWVEMGLSTDWGTQIVDMFWTKTKSIKSEKGIASQAPGLSLSTCSQSLRLKDE